MEEVEKKNDGETARDDAVNTDAQHINKDLPNVTSDSVPPTITDVETEENADNDIMLADDDADFTPYVPKLNEKQLKTIQIIAGLFCGFIIWFTLGLGAKYNDNVLMRWLFLLIFGAIMIIRSQIEKRTGIELRTFMKFFLIGLIVFLGVFVIYGASTGMFNQPFIAGN